MNTEKNEQETVSGLAELDGDYWNARWEKGETGWDIGYASPAITEYVNHLPEKDIAILIPGCGNAYEAQHLVANGYTNITLLDIAPEAVARLHSKFNTRNVRVLCADFFSHEGQYNLVIEQTFFCALPVNRRGEYVQKMAALLKPGGKIAGLLFASEFEKAGPPFGGTAKEYREIFNPYFDIEYMEICNNSIPPRQGNELFITCSKKEITSTTK